MKQAFTVRLNEKDDKKLDELQAMWETTKAEANRKSIRYAHNDLVRNKKDN